MPFVHEHRTRVRYDETDQGRVVYHAKYLHYFEAGRTEFFRAIGMRYRDMEDSGFFLVVTEAGLRYRASARYDDELLVRTWITELKPVTVRFAYEVYREPGSVLLCTGDTRLACVGTDFKPRRMPPEVIALLTRQLGGMG